MTEKEGLIQRLELEADSIERRAKKLTQLAPKGATHKAINEMLDMASGERRVIDLIKEVVKFLRRD
jgi:hypothetical protein